MSEIKDGGPAFPTASVIINGVDEKDGVSCFSGGMTLRDYFAAKAMAGGLGHRQNKTMRELVADEACAVFAAECYEMADAMLKAREVKP